MGGLESYVRSLTPELARLAPNTRFTVFCSPGGHRYLREVGWDAPVDLVVPRVIGRRGLKAIGELTLLGALAGRCVDLLHSPAMTAPLRTRAVNVVMIPDVTWIVCPDPGDAGTVRLWRTIVPPVARRADRLITHSSAAADHIVDHLRVPRSRIDVIALAASVGSSSTPTPAAELRSRLRLGDGPVILSVSARRVHKNLDRLILAMTKVIERVPTAVLVLPGNPTPHERNLRALVEREDLDANVMFLPYVSSADLDGLYALASCFAFASLNEGFGIPILEAMRHGLPVACSNVSSLPEVAGDAAHYFDPYDVNDMARALLDILSDSELASRLNKLGTEREALFTWEATARGTLDSYARAWAAACNHGA